ncbi:hypothetical protein GJ744_009357 [Endocarpon pusillum]|uniref:Uncharacterized protein n=1 Tax=Endocarpon pusillum TaxID=364733 RepID=A0A8H7AJQ7_9EURO|nr:hypothetical protein GJ744_009357 [Endocarpon pusillum]
MPSLVESTTRDSMNQKVAGRDDVTGEKLIQRDNDSEKTWRKRMAKFEETSTGLLNFYKQKQAASVVVVRGHSSDEISPQIFDDIDPKVYLI